MTTLLHATGSAEMLAIVPSLAGFTPRDSIVLLPFHDSRSYGALRIDLPSPDIDVGEFAAGSVALAARVEGIQGLAVVVYAEAGDDGSPLPREDLVAAIVAAASAQGLRIVDALCVTALGWGSYLDRADGLRSLAEIPAPPAIPGVADVSGDQDAGADLPRADHAVRERVAHALIDLETALRHERAGTTGADEHENPQALAAALLLDDLPHFFESLMDLPENPPPFATAALLWCLDRPGLRDVALLQWATNIETAREALDAQHNFARRGVAYPARLAEIALGKGPRPAPDRLGIALQIVRTAAARAPKASRPAPLTLAAWFSWALGRSSHASHYLALAREIDPDYSLADIVSTLIDSVILPDWAFHAPQEAAR